MKCGCGEKMVKKKIEITRGLNAEGFKCQKCGETEFTENQMREALAIKEKALSLAVKRKLGMLGGSLILRIPKDVKEAMSLRKGEEVKIIVENKRMIVRSA